MKRDALKTADCERAGITLLRLTNEEVFGERASLIEKLRNAYREANLKMKAPKDKR